jgi:hypothetical protein
MGIKEEVDELIELNELMDLAIEVGHEEMTVRQFTRYSELLVKYRTKKEEESQ